MRSSASMRAWNCADRAASSILRSSPSDVLSACVYMATSQNIHWELIYIKNVRQASITVTCLCPVKPARQRPVRPRQRPVFVAGAGVKPLFRRRKQPAIDLAAERSRRPARPVPRQQRRRQQRVAQHDAAVMVDQEDPRGEGVGIAESLAAAD